MTKVNGTVQYITEIPAIGALIEKLDGLTKPVLKRFGVVRDGVVTAEAEAEATVEE